MALLHLALLPVAAASANGDHWAVLVAGSSGMANYRHQADVCHAYQVVSRTIKPENIIVMAYDDIAQNPSNPSKGQVFNKPTASGTAGKDVYAGCKIDYSANEVNVGNFIKVLTGDGAPPPPTPAQVCTGPFASNKTKCSEGTECCCVDEGLFDCKESGWLCCGVDAAGFRTQCARDAHGNRGCQEVKPKRVLRSTNASRVFVNFVDHGAVGLIGFPSGGGMSAQQLKETLTTMHSHGLYKELVFYLEACESGSMFDNEWLEGMNIFATTAANGGESSWGTYCPPDDKVDGTSIGTCLGDLYSVNWMEDSDALQPSESLELQYHRVKNATTKSHVTQFGDTDRIANELVTNFQGNTDSVPATTYTPQSSSPRPRESVTLDSRAAELQYAFSRFLETESDADAAILKGLVDERLKVNARFARISHAVAGRDVTSEPLPPKVDMACQHEVLTAYYDACADGRWTTSELKHGATLAKLCAEKHANHAPIVAAIRAECSA